MFTSSAETAESRDLEGLRSTVLLQSGSGTETDLSVTWVEVAPGARQPPHSHPPQQVYVIVEGRGRMLVGGEERELGRGELALIASGAEHGIVNIGDGPLIYVSAATPSFKVTDVYDSGELSWGDGGELSR